jgi:hypothetical protein
MNVSKLVKLLPVLGIASLVSSLSHAAPAPTAEIAKKCREMMIQAHPPARPGSKTGNAQEQRKYFQTCIAQKGKMEGQGDATSTEGRGR